MLKNKQIILVPSGLLFIAVITGALLVSSNTYATDTNTSQDNVTVNVPVSCTMNGTGMSSHTASIPNGTYQADIGTTTLQSFCNDSQGFAIYAIGYTNEEYGNTNLIGATQNQTIVTGTATTTGSPDVSNWAVKLATSSGATYPLTLDNSFGSYHNVPTEYTKVAHRDSGTDLGSSATGSTLTTTYAAYISKTQAADTYNGKVKYTLVHPASEVPAQPIACEAKKICYNINSSSVIGEMDKQNIYNDTNVTLWAPNFKREGYGFAGWNDKFDYSGNFYGPNQTIAIPSEASTNGLSLYASWVKSTGTMQNWNSCSSLTQGAVTALKDSRDNNVYAIAKLADNKCWMIENLRLDNTSELSTTNTHNPSLPLTNTYNVTNPITSNYLSASTDPTQTAWCTSSSSACNDQSMIATNNTTYFIDNTASNYDASGNVYSYGNYYNWYSATAGQGTYSKSSGNTTGDICPVGWHLPTGDDDGELKALYTAIVYEGATGSDESIIFRSFPINYTKSGYIYDSSFRNRNGSGDYHTATAMNAGNVYRLNIGTYGVSAGEDGQSKNYGKTVRCIADY